MSAATVGEASVSPTRIAVTAAVHGFLILFGIAAAAVIVVTWPGSERVIVSRWIRATTSPASLGA